jgi:hypothetical protein
MAEALGESFDVFASDVHPFGFGAQIDFLDDGFVLSTLDTNVPVPAFDWIVTNPPFAAAAVPGGLRAPPAAPRGRAADGLRLLRRAGADDPGPMGPEGVDGECERRQTGRCGMSSLYARFRPLLAEAVDGRFYTIDYLDWLVRTGRAQFWPSLAADGRPLAAIVTELRDYPGCKAIHGLAAAGDLAEIVGLLIPAAEAWGRARGCAFAIIESRPGWQKALRKHGYEPHQVAVRKELLPAGDAGA